jgi:quinol monooxygenase YgiN
VIKSRTKPRTYVVYGRFKNEAAFESHMQSPFHHRLVPPILECVDGEMDLHMLDWRS